MGFFRQESKDNEIKQESNVDFLNKYQQIETKRAIKSLLANAKSDLEFNRIYAQLKNGFNSSIQYNNRLVSTFMDIDAIANEVKCEKYESFDTPRI